MAWVRFPDGSRRKVERVTKADAQHDVDELAICDLWLWIWKRHCVHAGTSQQASRRRPVMCPESSSPAAVGAPVG
jgi:hypothetical protein